MRPVSSRTASPEHTQVEGEPRMTAESIGEVREVLVDFPGLTDAAVIEHGTGDDRCLIGYVVPSAAGLAMGELQAFARKSLPHVGRPAAIGHISTAFGTRVSMADLFSAPTAGDMDR